MRYGYQFHAHATGVAGQLTHPFKDVLEVQAPAALPITGGYSRGRVENFRYKEIVSFKAAYTQVTGGYCEETDSWDTVMTATVEGFEIMGMIKADLIVGRLSSRYPVNGDEPSILPLGSRFEGLQIAGNPVNVVLNTGLYCKLDTHSKVYDAYKNDASFREEFDRSHQVGKHEELPETHQAYFPWGRHKPTEEIPHADGMIAASLVKSLEYETDAFRHYGHVIYLPHFGKIILGQLLVNHKARRLTMVQVDLGCSVCGMMTAASGESNGTPMPPHPKPSGT